MADTLSCTARSENMRRIRAKDTEPEIAVRRALHRMGLRFRLHASGLPGKPDVVLRRHNAVVLIHGCFWHQHRRCIDGHVVMSREAIRRTGSPNSTGMFNVTAGTAVNWPNWASACS